MVQCKICGVLCLGLALFLAGFGATVPSGVVAGYGIYLLSVPVSDT